MHLQERLKGVNLGGWFSQVDCIEEKDPEGFPGFFKHAETFLSKQDFELLKKVGFNHVRLPIDYQNFFKGKELQPEEKAFALLDKALTEIQQAGLAVILDLHKCPGHDFHLGCTQEQPFFSDPECRKDACKVWAFLAERYSTQPEIMLELLNEPAGQDSKVWDKIKDELYKNVRAHAPKNTIVIGSNRWNSAEEFKDLTPVDDDNVIYSFHTYTPVCFTHQYAAWIQDPFFHQTRIWPGEYSAPEGEAQTRLGMDFGKWDKDRLCKSLQNAFDFRKKYDLPVACNEFGVYAQVNRESQINWLNDFMEILRENDVGYSYWNYKNLDFGLVSKGESLHKDLPQYNNPERLDKELLDILANG